VIVFYLPYAAQWLNRLQAALGAGFLLSALAGVVAMLSEPGSDAGGAAWALALAPALYVGWSAAAQRFASFADSTELGSPFVVELRSRYLLSEGGRRGVARFLGKAEAAARGAGGSDDNDVSVVAVDGEFSSRGSVSGKSASGSGGGGGRRGDDSDALTARSGGSGGRRSVGSKGSGGTRRTGGTAGASGGGGGGFRADENFLASAASADAHAEKSRMPPSVRAATRLMDEGLAAHSGSGLMELFAAAFHGGTRGNTHLERVHLRAAAAKADPASELDVHFAVWARLADLADAASGAGGGKLTVERRVEFEALLGQSRAAVSRLRHLMLQFWSTLAERHPSLSALQDVGLQINEGIAGADAVFRQLLALCPNSPSVMRAYAEFLAEVSNDPRKGEGERGRGDTCSGPAT
jgi:hypothetical protein